MHDPMVVAHEIPLPIPKRERWQEQHYKGRRWGFTRRRRTNAENLGEPVYPWWRPTGWTFALGGHVYGMRRLATIWHVEPKGRDSGTVCKHYVKWQDDDGQWHITMKRAWRWHLWHWHIQVPMLQQLRARLFDRCEMCGRKGRPNHSHQWDGHKLGWWKFRSRRGLYHSECSALMHTRNANTEHELIERQAIGALSIAWDVPMADVPRLLFPGSGGYSGQHDGPGDFNLRYRLEKLIERTADEPARVSR